MSTLTNDAVVTVMEHAIVTAHIHSLPMLFVRPSTSVAARLTIRATKQSGKAMMTAPTELTPLPRMWKWAVVSGLLTTILGILVLIWPGPSLVVAAAFFGAYLLVSGIAQVIGAFGVPVASGGGRVLMFISGAASLILAVLCFRSLADSILLLAIWISVGFIFRGVAAIVTAVGDSALPSRGWMIFAGVVTLLAGFIILAYPFPSVQVLILVTGFWLIVIGVSEVVAGVRVRGAANHLDRLSPAPSTGVVPARG